MAPVYVLLFATVYYLMERANGATFGVQSAESTRCTSRYRFTTVGFDDITANPKRLVRSLSIRTASALSCFGSSLQSIRRQVDQPVCRIQVKR